MQLVGIPLPSLTAICLTANRPEYLPLAIECFLLSDYPNKKLLVLDTGNDPVSDFGLIPSDPQITYIHSLPLSHGALLNTAVQRSDSDICVITDDDDWYPPSRITEQARALEESETAALVAYRKMLFYEVETGDVYQYTGPDWYGTGNSQCFYRSFWELNPFSEQPCPDTLFWEAARKQGVTLVLGDGLMVARAHRDSTCPPCWRAHNFQRIETPVFPEGFELTPKDIKELTPQKHPYAQGLLTYRPKLRPLT
jgi:hypothetical protein